jgi:hypothetical protein
MEYMGRMIIEEPPTLIRAIMILLNVAITYKQPNDKVNRFGQIINIL